MAGRVYEAVTVEDTPQDDDVFDAFNKWKGSFDDAESPGTIRAFRLPMDEQGKASHSSTGQIRLGAWPVDQYDFDTLCDKIIREYMFPQETVMAVRLIGTLAGKGGVRFNKIVTLQRNGLTALPSPTAVAKDSMSDILRAIQESNERTMRMMQEMRGVAPAGGNNEELMRTVAMMKMLNEPMMQMMGPLMQAVAGRPAGPSTNMKDMIETMVMVDKFLGRRGGGGGPAEPDWIKVTTAVAGVAKPLLEMAAQNKNTTPVRTRKAIAAPQPAPATSPAQAEIRTSTNNGMRPVDLPMDKPSPLPTQPSLNPGPNIEAPTPEKADPMFSETKKQIDALVQVAEMGADPSAIADRFFEDSMLALDDNAYGQLAGLIESDGFLNTIGIYNTKVKQFAEFFGKMRERLVQRIVAEDEPDNDAA